MARDWFAGAMVWTGFDYRGESRWPATVNNFGIMDLCGFPKASYWYYKANWTDEDVLNYIEANNIRLHPLYYREDGTIDIKRRLGCMCCPMIYWKRRAVEFRQHPVMVRAYCRAAQKHREAHPDTDAAKKYTDVYQLFFRNMFFDTQEKWEQWLADNNASVFGITDYRQWLMDYFKVDLPEVK